MTIQLWTHYGYCCIHNSTDSKLPLHLNSFLWWNFNKVEHGISYGHEDDNFGREAYTGFTASLQSNFISISIPDGVKPLYFLHAVGSDTSILAGAMVISWDSLCPPSPVHLTVTSSNPTLVFNSLLTANNTCANFPHLSTLPATISRIAVAYAFCTRITGMPLTRASRLWHHFGSLIPYMIASAKSAIQTLRSSNLVSLPHLRHISKLLLMGPLTWGCQSMPNGFAHLAPIENCLSDSLLKIPCLSITTF